MMGIDYLLIDLFILNVIGIMEKETPVPLAKGVLTHPGDIVHGWRLVSRTATIVGLGVAARGEATLALYPQGQGEVFIVHRYHIAMWKLPN